MNTIPPNNLDQLVAWIRIFAEEIQEQLVSYELKIQNLQNTVLQLQNKENQS